MYRIRISFDDRDFLRCWGSAAFGDDHSHRVARLLLRIVLEIRGPPPEHADCPRPCHRFVKGRPFHGDAVKLSSLRDSAGTRALWMWGYERKCRNISESFRLLLKKLHQAYPDLEALDLDRRIECLYKFADLIKGETPDAENRSHTHGLGIATLLGARGRQHPKG